MRISSFGQFNPYIRNTFHRDRSVERLASGSRINSASDDAAGLSISTRMLAATRSNDVALRNVNDGTSLVQVAEAGLGTVSNILTRMKKLATRANNGTLSATDKTSLQGEFSQLRDEISHIAKTTSYNGKELLSSDGSIPIQSSSEANDVMDVKTIDVQVGSSNMDIANLDLTTDAATAMKGIDAALEKVSTARSEFGAMANRFEHVSDSLSNTNINLEAAKSRISDTDFLKEVGDMIKFKLLTKAEIAMKSHKNENSKMVLDLLD